MKYLDANLDKLIKEIDLGLEMLTESKKVDKPSCFLSQEQIDEHYDVHYQSYIDGYKKSKKDFSSMSYSDVDECRDVFLRMSHNYNGLFLHDIYFSSLGKSEPSKGCSKLIDSSFGGMEKLEQLLKAATMAAEGWAIIGYNRVDNNLSCTIVDNHEIGGMLICPVLALDAFEHSYYIDYRSNKEKYTTALLKDINWDIVSKRIDELL
jgi:Fe-Mn family superoxide dismutase